MKRDQRIGSRHGWHDDALTAREQRGAWCCFGVASAQMFSGSVWWLAAQKTLGMNVSHPFSRFGNADGDNVELFLVDGIEHRGGGEQRDFVLAAASSEEHADLQLLHLFNLLFSFQGQANLPRRCGGAERSENLLEEAAAPV